MERPAFPESCERFQHLIFDLDGTLTFLDLPWLTWIGEVCGLLPVGAVDEFRESVLNGRAWAVFLNDCIKTGRLDPMLLAQVSERFERKYFKHIPNWRAISVLPELARGRTLSVWSNNTLYSADRSLREMGVRSLFDRVVTQGESRYLKPDPEPWSDSAAVCALELTVVVGDSENDVVAARTLGTSFVPLVWHPVGQ